MTEVIERDATRAPVKSDTPPEPKAPRLLDQVRERIRVLHYSRSTEATYLHWIKAYIHFHGLRHPRDMGAAEVEAYLSHLATARDVAAGTQNQAMHAILFLYKQVLGIDLPWLDGITRAKPSKRLPVVLTQDEARRLMAQTRGTAGLVVRLLYGTGMRLMEGLRLRIKDIDFDRRYRAATWLGNGACRFSRSVETRVRSRPDFTGPPPTKPASPSLARWRLGSRCSCRQPWRGRQRP